MVYETPVLDRGFVRLLESRFNFKHLQELKEQHGITFNRTSLNLSGACGMTLAIKAPFFISSTLAKFGLVNVGTIVDTKLEFMKIQFEDLVDTPLVSRQSIIDEMSANSLVMIKTPEKFQSGGCDNKTSQIGLPISTYVTVVTTGSFREWIGFVESDTDSVFLKRYQNAVKDILRSECFDLNSLK